MSLTNKSETEDLLLLRARYVALLRALQSTREHNPATLEALEQILPELSSELSNGSHLSVVPAPPPESGQRAA